MLEECIYGSSTKKYRAYLWFGLVCFLFKAKCINYCKSSAFTNSVHLFTL